MSRHLILTASLVVAALTLAACKPAPPTDPILTSDEVPATAAELAPPLTPAGAPVVVTATGADDDALQTAAGVQQVDDFSEQPIHLFGVSSADPGPNGMKVYARFAPGGAAWTVFPIAEAAAYEVVSVQPGKIGIKLTEAAYDEAKGELGSTERKIIVAWTESADGGAPTSVTVTPAQ